MSNKTKEEKLFSICNNASNWIDSQLKVAIDKKLSLIDKRNIRFYLYEYLRKQL